MSNEEFIQKCKEYVVMKYICPHCNSQEKFIVEKDFKNSYIIGGYDGNTYLIDTACNKCKKLNQIYVDRETKKIYTTNIEFYMAFPERYDLKKMLYYLVDRIDFIKTKTKEFLDKEGYKLDKTIREEIEEWNEICDFRSIDMYCLIQELIDDRNDQKYIVTVKKKESKE